ncbi:hypothetical protein Tco_0991600 [Tanacetum coccineum]|uniref:Uncharacterized protein n=1 Tax=Tanacetum coccineum TaxID=301880 RepID=A0ABQ5EZN9_9ASTR
MEYAPTVNQQPEFPKLDSGLIVLVFQKGDDPIDAINHMMSFLTAVVTSRYPTTNNQLRNSSNPRQQATINDGRVTLQPIQGRQTSFAAGTTRTYTPGASGNALVEVHNPDNMDNNMINQVVQAMSSSEQSNVVNHSETEITSDSNIIHYSHVNDTLTAELERYKEQVKVLKDGQNVDLKSNDNVSKSDFNGERHTKAGKGSGGGGKWFTHGGGGSLQGKSVSLPGVRRSRSKVEVHLLLWFLRITIIKHVPENLYSIDVAALMEFRCDNSINLNVDESTIPSDPIVSLWTSISSTFYAGLRVEVQRNQPNVKFQLSYLWWLIQYLMEVNISISSGDLVDFVTIGIPSISEDDLPKKPSLLQYEWRPTDVIHQEMNLKGTKNERSSEVSSSSHSETSHKKPILELTLEMLQTMSMITLSELDGGTSAKCNIKVKFISTWNQYFGANQQAKIAGIDMILMDEHI